MAASMKKLIALSTAGCLVLAAWEKRLAGDSLYNPGSRGDQAPPVGTVTPASPTLPEVK
jgi:hypothetical protein